MSHVYYSIGYIVYWGYIAFVMAVLAHSFMQAASYMLLCIVTVIKNGRQKDVRWHLVPADFFIHWREYTSNGAPDKITSKYCEWRGIFSWTIYPSPKPTKDTA